MFQALNIEITLIQNYDKLRKKFKMQNLVNCNDYKVTIAEFKVKICSIEDILLKELSKLEKLILMASNALNVLPERS